MQVCTDNKIRISKARALSDECKKDIVCPQLINLLICNANVLRGKICVVVN